MKVLILGANGMLGHKLYQVLSKDFEIYGTVKDGANNIRHKGIFGISGYLLEKIDCVEKVGSLLEDIKPDVVINCIGIIDKHYAEKNRQTTTWINAIFPHWLYQMCPVAGARLIHISTDCVFSGNKGNYKESSPADATDIYGKTKYLGEVTGDNVLTIRTSLIGRELVRSRGLLEWFISNKGKSVDGYSNAVFSGFPTVFFAQIIEDIITNHPELTGLYHISSEPIDKYNLLNMINRIMCLGIKVLKTTEYKCDRSLDSTKFRSKTGFKPPSWPNMVTELAIDARQYEKWR